MVAIEEAGLEAGIWMEQFEVLVEPNRYEAEMMTAAQAHL